MMGDQLLQGSRNNKERQREMCWDELEMDEKKGEGTRVAFPIRQSLPRSPGVHPPHILQFPRTTFHNSTTQMEEDV